MTEGTETIGVLFMAYGSPENLDQMEAYLLDVREGRQPSPELVHDITERYAQIGGKSPLLERTREQAEAVAAELNSRNASNGHRFEAYVGMRHWDPRIGEAVEQIERDAIGTVVSMVMAPHNSAMSIGKYYKKLDEVARDKHISFLRVESWHKHPGFLDAVSEKIEEGLQQFGNEQPYIVFTAHSLPAKILEMGDPYDDQLNETAHLLAKRFELKEDGWRFCYQSAGANAIPWLGPQIEEVVEELAREGKKDLLIVPIGFVCDHVEVLYDIDIEARSIATEHGARLERTPSLNASPTFVQALADIIEGKLEQQA